MNQNIKSNGLYKGHYKIDIPPGMNAFDVLYMLSLDMTFEEVAYEIERKTWENQQGCSQAMRND